MKYAALFSALFACATDSLARGGYGGDGGIIGNLIVFAILVALLISGINKLRKIGFFRMEVRWQLIFDWYFKIWSAVALIAVAGVAVMIVIGK